VVVASNYGDSDASGPFHAAAAGDTLVDGAGNPIGMSGGRCLLFSDDTLFTEATGTYATKKTFRYVIDSAALPATFRSVMTLWTDAGTATCKISIGADTAEVTSTATAESDAAAKKETTITRSAASGLVTVTYELKVEGGGVLASLKYTDLFAVY